MLRSETAGDPGRLERALRGLRHYQEANRPAPLSRMPAIAEVHGAALRDYGGEGPDVLFIPSLINPPNVLDLNAERSLLRWLANRGHHVLLLDWGSAARQRANLSVAGHVEQIVIPLLRALAPSPSLVGYCLGGTMAVAAACLTPVRSLVTLAAPWHFSGFPEDARAMLARLWTSSQASVNALNLLPMEVLQSAFWNLDPRRTITKFEEFAGFAPDSAEYRAFVTLEDWANDGPPLPAAAAREMFGDFLAADLPGGGRWMVNGQAIDPATTRAPQLHVVSTRDKIVPATSAITIGERWSLDQGHVGMIVGGRAKAKLWEPLDSWLSQCSIE
jgi:poly[(R)-3-hydroxyalkanoate] polymerase subunit PhaC